MDTRDLEKHIEYISSKVHGAWVLEEMAQGFHSPEDCPLNDGIDDSRNTFGKFTRRCGKCHADMYGYDELPEHVKDFDRATVRAVLSAIKELG